MTSNPGSDHSPGGEGRPGALPPVRDVMLLPGLNTTSKVWRDVLPFIPTPLVAHTPELAALPTMEAIAEDLVADAPARFHLVGYSLGGYVALAMLEKYPDRIESLVLIGSAAHADNQAVKDYRQTCLDAAAAGRHEALNEAGAAQTFHDDSARRPELLAAYLDMMRSYGVDRYVAHLQACMTRPDRHDVLRQTDKPLLLMAGDQDRVVPIGRQKASAEAADAELVIVTGAGHQVPLEQPQVVGARLRDWLLNPRPSRRTQDQLQSQ